MPYLRFEDDDDASLGGTITSALLGAVAGFAVGMLVAQRVGTLEIDPYAFGVSIGHRF